MFNLKSHTTTDDLELLRNELQIFDVVRSGSGYEIGIGDESVSCNNLSDATGLINSGINELREHCWESWKSLADLSERIVKESGRNFGGINNLLFLHAVKRSFLFSRIFSDLNFITEILRKILNTDIAKVDDHLIDHFNSEYLVIQSLHRLIMSEKYRCKLLARYSSMTKQAQISGPWANLDLPTGERVWEWDDAEDEHFESRKQSRRQQTRYNPENATQSGFYYVWQDYTRDPYKFEDMKEDSPYKSRHSLLIA